MSSLISYHLSLSSYPRHSCHNPIATFFHQPLRCTGSTTDAYAFHLIEPFHVNLIGTFNLMTVRIDAFALIKKNFTITTLTPGYE